MSRAHDSDYHYHIKSVYSILYPVLGAEIPALFRGRRRLRRPRPHEACKKNSFDQKIGPIWLIVCALQRVSFPCFWRRISFFFCCDEPLCVPGKSYRTTRAILAAVIIMSYILCVVCSAGIFGGPRLWVVEGEVIDIILVGRANVY